MSQNQSLTPKTLYDVDFYKSVNDGSRRSAQIVLEKFFSYLRPNSIADIGCGEGYWLAEASKLGVNEICGIDGDYVRRDRLAIPVDAFIPQDLSQPFDIKKRFDLAMTLEVAEHIDASKAEIFVANLVGLAPAVLFSAAVPGQGGTDHVNEQWPSYWSSLFSSHGYVCIDLLRPKIWHDERIEVWYRQNLLVFISKDHPVLKEPDFVHAIVSAPMDAMHADLIESKIAMIRNQLYWATNPGIRKSTKQFIGAVLRRFKKGKP